MRNFLTILILMIVFSSCGKLKKSLGSGSETNLLSPSDPISTPGVPLSLTPGSYFKVMKEVGSAKDTRVIEFQYLSGGRFIMTNTSFPGGNLSSSFFHKKTGTFIDVGGQIAHTTISDSCNDLSPNSTFIYGDRNNVVTVVWKGSKLSFYSYASWSLPPEILSQITYAVEDVGCVKFKD